MNLVVFAATLTGLLLGVWLEMIIATRSLDRALSRHRREVERWRNEADHYRSLSFAYASELSRRPGRGAG
ncbi:hypothetical protein [Actinocorallia longicatena]